jgi:hypothetical protein
MHCSQLLLLCGADIVAEPERARLWFATRIQYPHNQQALSLDFVPAPWQPKGAEIKSYNAWYPTIPLHTSSRANSTTHASVWNLLHRDE